MYRDHAATSRRVAQTRLAVLLLASTLGVMAGAIVMPVLELARADLGISSTAMGFVATAHAAAIAATSPAVGWALDRWGVRVPLGVGLLLYGFGGGAGLITTSYPVLIGSRLVLGAGAAAVFSGTTVALLASASGPRQDRIMGWRTSASMTSGLIWPLLAGVLGGIDWHAAFAIYLVGVPLGIATLLLSVPGGGTGARTAHGSVLVLLRGYPVLLGWLVLMALIGLMTSSLVAFVPQRLAQLDCGEPVFASVFMAVLSTTSALIGFAYSWVRAHAGFAVLLRAAATCWVAAFLIMGTSTGLVTFDAAAIVFGAGYGLLFPIVTVLIGETPPAFRRGQATALSATALFLGQFLAPLAFGPFMEATSTKNGYLLAAAACALLLAILLIVRIRDPRLQKEAAEIAAAADRYADRA
ncbi:MFS transporter, partial [Nocardia sp. NPDC004260]